jgi:hypothetical protein
MLVLRPPCCFRGEEDEQQIVRSEMESQLPRKKQEMQKIAK